MKQTASITQLSSSTPVSMEYGTVQVGNNNNYVVQSGCNVFTASPAFSCVIRPEAGDRVMCSIDDAGSNFILAVLQRSSDLPAVMQFSTDVNMSVPQGKVSISARDGIAMTSAENVSLLSPNLKISAAEAQVTIDKVNATGSELTGNIRRVSVFADRIDTIAETVTQRAKNLFRWTEQVEQVTAGDMLQTVRNLLNIRSRQAVITAKQDVKIDGERVHMG